MTKITEVWPLNSHWGLTTQYSYLLYYYFYFICMYVLLKSMHLCQIYAVFIEHRKENFLLRSRIIDSFELSCVYWLSNPGSFKRQPVPLTTRLSFQLIIYIIYIYIYSIFISLWNINKMHIKSLELVNFLWKGKTRNMISF